MEFQHIVVAPMHGAFGAEVSGFDASSPIAPAVAAEINRAYDAYKLLVFRDAVTSIDRHKHLARVFGDAQIHPLFDALPGHPEVIQFMKDVDDTVNFGGAWHADMTCLEEPPPAACCASSRRHRSAATRCSRTCARPMTRCPNR